MQINAPSPCSKTAYCGVQIDQLDSLRQRCPSPAKGAQLISLETRPDGFGTAAAPSASLRAGLPSTDYLVPSGSLASLCLIQKEPGWSPRIHTPQMRELFFAIIRSTIAHK